MFAGRRAPLVTAALGVRYGRRKPNPLVTRRVFRVSAGRLGFMYSSAPPAPLYGHYDPYTDASVVGHDALGAPIWAPWSGVGMAVLVGVPHTMATAAVHLNPQEAPSVRAGRMSTLMPRDGRVVHRDMWARSR